MLLTPSRLRPVYLIMSLTLCGCSMLACLVAMGTPRWITHPALQVGLFDIYYNGAKYPCE